MRFRLSLELVAEIDDERLLEKYGTIDPYMVAAVVQRKGQEEFREMQEDADDPIVSAHLSVVPVYGT